MKVKNLMKKITDNIKAFFIKNEDDDEEIIDQKEVKLVGFRLYEVIILLIIVTITGVFSGSFLMYRHTEGYPKTNVTASKHIKEFEEAFKNVTDNYYEEVDKNKLIDAAIKGMLSTLDIHTSYMNSEETEQFNERMKGNFQGIGIEFITDEGYEHTVTGVFEGSPALAAGVKVGDKIISVDGFAASSKTGTEIASYIKGSNVSQITMVVNRDGKEIPLNIKKSLVTIPSVVKKVYNINDKKVGYIYINIFADNTYNQFKTSLESLESDGISSLVIDVRDNSGGYLHIASNIAELFLSLGDVVYQMQDKSGIEKHLDATIEKRTYPVAVLINKYSASASEVLAAALKDVYGASIVGITSFGKGTVQQPNELSNGGMIKITTDKWLTPKGECIDKVGIKPTVEVSASTEYNINPTEENDNQLQKALEIVTK